MQVVFTALSEFSQFRQLVYWQLMVCLLTGFVALPGLAQEPAAGSSAQTTDERGLDTQPGDAQETADLNPSSENVPVLTLTGDEGGIVVAIGDRLFTRFDYTSYDKPILYPVFGPGQIAMTRNSPMREVEGEQQDHPHHKSIWTGHEINHVDFWSEKTGAVRVQSVDEIDNENKLFRIHSSWVRKEDDSIVLTDRSVYQFGFDEQTRWIDVTQTFIASHGEIVFGDTKEGFFAIRVHPKLRIADAPDAGVTDVTGHIINSAGQTDGDCWGKPAAWVDYSGVIDGQPVGIAIFDHPSNFRHPTTWHARDYGLVAANPFGLHHFTGAEPGTGELKLAEGEQLTLRYRAVFHAGDHQAAAIERRYAEWAAGQTESNEDGQTESNKAGR